MPGFVLFIHIISVAIVVAAIALPTVAWLRSRRRVRELEREVALLRGGE